MKVVLFCGGLGTRLREHSDTVPKPLVTIGHIPIIMHLMRFYAHFGHKEFILCLGYRGDMIREYFLNYNECMTNDFTMSNGGKDIELHSRAIDNWSITFVDTGLHANIGMRLLAVKEYLAGEKVFLANYSDGLSNHNLNMQIDDFLSKDLIASFLAVQPTKSFHFIDTNENGVVQHIGDINSTDIMVNAGYFVLREQIFDYIYESEELVEEPFQRLIKKQKLLAFKHDGFWSPMDTFKEKIRFDRMYARGDSPWEVWKNS